MKRKIEYKDAPQEIEQSLSVGERVMDFLPPPEQLVEKVEKEKITIALSKRNVDFFKKAAAKEGVGYQVMINSLLDSYVERYS